VNIEKGMYVRTTYGYINKLIEFENNYNVKFPSKFLYLIPRKNSLEVPYPIDKESIKSASKNLIDLIEVGDLVNGCTVYGFETWKDNIKRVRISGTQYLKNEEIEDILIHEIIKERKFEVVKASDI